MNNNYFPEITIVMRCAICQKEKVYHQYCTEIFRKSYTELVKKIEQDGWKIITDSKRDIKFRCLNCKPNIASIRVSKEREERALKKMRECGEQLECIETKRKENEMTTEEIEDLAKGVN